MRDPQNHNDDGTAKNTLIIIKATDAVERRQPFQVWGHFSPVQTRNELKELLQSIAKLQVS